MVRSDAKRRAVILDGGIADEAVDDKGVEGGVTLDTMIAGLEGIFAGLPEAVVVAAPDRRIAWANRAVEEMFGYPLGALYGHTTEMLYADAAGYRQTGETHYRPGASGGDPHYGIRYRRASGEVFESETTGAPIHAPDGALLGYIGIIRDVSQERCFYDALTRLQALGSDQHSTREEKIEAILALGIEHLGLPCGVVALRDPAASGGLTPHHRLGTSEAAALDRLAPLGASDRHGLHHDCSAAEGALLAAPLVVEGEEAGFLVFFGPTPRQPFAKTELDLMQLLAMKVSYKLANIAILQRLEEARRQAEAANLAKSRFLGSLSHDLRTPFAGMLGMLDLLDVEPEATARAEMTGHIRRAAETLMDLLNDALDYAQIEQGALNLRDEPVDLAGLAAEAIAPFAPLAAQRGVEIRSRLAEGVPSTVFGDPLRLRQVLNNLLSNAVKYTEQGCIALEIGIEPAAGGAPLLHLAVRDTGVGIPADRQVAIFEAFEQADTQAARVVGGVGLGLAISRRLAQAMGGEIALSSRVGEGSRFTLSLPCRPAPGSIVAPSPSALSSAAPRRVLLAEDNATIAILLNRMLGRLGHDVHHVTDGSAAIAAARTTRFDIAVFDLRMPDVDGIDAACAIRRDTPDDPLPVLVLTAEAIGGQAEVKRHPEIADCLAKPIDWKALEASIQRHARSAVPSQRASTDDRRGIADIQRAANG